MKNLEFRKTCVSTAVLLLNLRLILLVLETDGFALVLGRLLCPLCRYGNFPLLVLLVLLLHLVDLLGLGVFRDQKLRRVELVLAGDVQQVGEQGLYILAGFC
jgi:hypothetical protein